MKRWKKLLIAAACCSTIFLVAIFADSVRRGNEAKRTISEVGVATANCLEVFDVVNDGVKTKIAIVDTASNALDKFDEPWISPDAGKSVGESLLEAMDKFNENNQSK